MALRKEFKMDGSGAVLVSVCVPLFGSFLLPVIGRVSRVLRNAFALLLVLAALAAAAFALPDAMSGAPAIFRLELPLGMTIGFLGDALAVFMALSASISAAVIVIYSFGYIHKYPNQNEYYMMVVLFVGAMMGLVFSTNLIFIYLFWEISAVCCWRLIGFFRTEDIVRRADKAFLITAGGALLMLIGFVGIYAETGTFDLTALSGYTLSTPIMILILFGILSKSATLPLHSWLPDAGVAPSPVTALLHAAVLVKIGVYIYARLFLISFQLEPVWETIVPVIAAVSAIISAGAAIVENDIKRIIAYSTISQLAFILLGLSCGTMMAAAGGLLYILMHSFAKAGLFLCAGIIEHSTHTKDIRKMSGLSKRLPITAAAFICCAFSVMGIPPFGGFFSKYLVINGALLTGNTWITAVFILGAVMTVIYLMRVFVKVFFGELSHPDLKEDTRTMVCSVAFLAALSLLAGVFINLPAKMTTFIAESIGRW